MKTIVYKKISIIFLSFILFFQQMQAQGFLKASGQKIVDGKGNEVLLRGVGLGGWMLQEPYMLQLSGVVTAQHDIKNKIKDLVGEEGAKHFYKSWLANHCTKADIDSLAAWGFNSVRLPMHFNLYTPPVSEEPVASQNTWLAEGFAMTDSLLNWCKANKIYLILDLHAAPGAQGADVPIADKINGEPSLWQSEANQQKTIALWQKLAERYKDEKWIGGYDLLNETNYGFIDGNDKNGCADTLNAPLKKLLTDIAHAIRKIDTSHLLFIEGNCWANNYKGLLPFDDNNTALSFHRYWNYNNDESIKGFLKLSAQYNMPLWMGESGENSNAWFTQAVQLLEKNGIGWAWWPLKKIGINNPLQIQAPTGYAAIVNYWKGQSEKPAKEAALQTLMTLASNTNIKNCVVKKDVIDALFRQVNDSSTKAFQKHSTSEVIFAANFNLGRAGFAYHDEDSANYRVSTGKNVEWNKGHVYRNDGVDISPATFSKPFSYYVYNFMAGEWLQYTVHAENTGVYLLQLKASATQVAGAISVNINGKEYATKNLDATNNPENWQTIQQPVTLKKGNNIIRVKATQGNLNFYAIQFLPIKKSVPTNKKYSYQ